MTAPTPYRASSPPAPPPWPLADRVRFGAALALFVLSAASLVWLLVE